MCGRYQISMEEDILEMREILAEINRRYFGTPMQDKIKTGETFHRLRAGAGGRAKGLAPC